jgi:hypothetical protein
LVFDRQSRLYRLAESGAASSRTAEFALGKRKAPLKGEVVLEENRETNQIKANPSALDDEEMSEEKDFESEDERAREEDLVIDYASRTFILPSCSKWFSFSDIHELEMQSLPEFFCAKYP